MMHSKWLAFVWLPLVFSAGACSGKEGSGEVADGPAQSPTSPDLTGVVLPENGGNGTISGTADANPFAKVATAYLAGAPDSTSTTVVFLFSKPVKCADIGAAAWDARIPDGTQILELKIFGQMPGTFTAVTTVTPAPGEVSVNYTLSSTSTTPKETGSSGGSLVLETLTAGTSASGTFDIKFGANSLSGRFDAIYCPGGREP